MDIGSTAVGTAVASKAVILDSNKDYTGLRNITLTGELDAGSLDISGNADIDGTLETDALSIAGVAVTTTAAELNLIDGGTARGTTAIVDADGVLVNDAGTMRMTTMATLATYMGTKGLGPAYTRAASAPSSPNAGDWWFNTGFNALYIYDGTDGWVTSFSRDFGKGLYTAPNTFSLLATANGVVFIARFETEAQIIAELNTDVSTSSFRLVDADGTSPISSNSSGVSACSNASRGVLNRSKGTNKAYVYFTLSSHGSANDFGNSVVALLDASGCDHATRGVFTSGGTGNTMEYITIASTGNATDFGNQTVARRKWGSQAVANTTRGVWFGGDT